MNNYTFNIPIGDINGEGHGRYELFAFISNKPLDEIRDAYFSARKKYWELSPESFLNSSDSCRVPKHIVNSARELNYHIDDDFFGREEMANYVAWFCQLGDEDLTLTKVSSLDVLLINEYDCKGRAIFGFGYGLF